jgi:hypothetical protein
MSSHTPHQSSQSQRNHSQSSDSGALTNQYRDSHRGNGELPPWSATRAEISEGERALFRVLEAVGRAMIPSPPDGTSEIRSKDIESVIGNNFSNPAFLFAMGFLGEYKEENLELVQQTVKMRGTLLAGVETQLVKRPVGFKKENIFDAITDEEFADWMKTVSNNRQVCADTNSIYSFRSGQHDGKGHDDSMQNLAVASSKVARVLRAVGLKDFLMGISLRGLPDGAADSDESMTAVAKALTALGTVVRRLSKGLLPGEVVDKLVAPFETIEEAFDQAEDALYIRLVDARTLEIETQQAKEEREKALRQQRLAEKEAEERAIRAAEERRAAEAQQRAADQLREFHASFRAAPLPESARKMLRELEPNRQIPAQQQPLADHVAQVFRDIHERHLDWRGDKIGVTGDSEIENLGKVLFSSLNIGFVAETEGLQAEKFLKVKLPSKTPVIQQANDLFAILERSTAASRVIDSICQDSDGIVVVATLLLPMTEVKRYVSEKGRIRGSLSRGALSEDDASGQLETLRTRKYAAIQDTLMRGHVKRQARSYNGSENVTSGEEQEVPELVKRNIDAQVFHSWIEEKRLHVAPLENPKRVFSMALKKLKDEAGFIAEYQKLVARSLVLLEVDKLRAEMIERRGFTLVEAAGEPPVMRHTVYDIHEVLPPEEEHWAKKLNQLREHFLQCEMSWDVLLQEARIHGFQVTWGESGTLLKKPCGEEVLLSESRFIPLHKMREVNALIQQSKVAATVQLQRAAREDRRRRGEKTLLEEQILPPPGAQAVVLDTSVFLRLGAPQRSGSATWLDLLTCISRLPNVRILVPASVADFELLGEIFPFEALDATSVDGRPSPSYHAVKAFFSRACRIQIQGDSASEVVVKNPYQSTPRICIVETPEDREVYDLVARIIKDTAGNEAQRLHRLHAEVYHQGVGDKAIHGLIRRAPFQNHTTVITDDLKFSDNLEHYVGTRPISTCTTGTLLRAGWGCRESEPFSTLEWGETSIFDDIVKEIVEGSSKSPARQFVFEESRLGERISNNSPEVYTLESIIRQGIYC